MGKYGFSNSIIHLVLGLIIDLEDAAFFKLDEINSNPGFIPIFMLCSL